MEPFGLELLLDLKGCHLDDLTCEKLTEYFILLCGLIEMKRHGEPVFWEGHGDAPLERGISALQFIETSSVVVHALPLLSAVYVNIFSCKSFDGEKAKRFSMDFWKAESAVDSLVVRT